MGFSRNVLFLILAMFASFLGIGATVPLLPVHLRHTLGLSNFWSGFLVGLLGASALLSRFPAGRLADRKGRKLTAALGFGLCGAAGLFYAIPSVGSMAMARIVHGTGEAMLFTAVSPWITEMGGEEKRARLLGYLSSAVWGGLAAGPLVAGLLRSFPFVSWFVAGMGVLAILLLWNIPADTPPGSEVPRRLVPWRETLIPGNLLGLVNIPSSVLMAFLPLLLLERGSGASAAFTAYASAVLFGRLLLGGLPDRWGPRPSLLAGMTLMTASMAALTFITNPLVTVIACFFLGLGYSLPWPALATVVIGRVPSYERGSAIAVLGAYFDVYVAIGSISGGAIAGAFGLRSVFLFGVIAAGSALLFTALYKLKTITPREHTDTPITAPD